MGYNSVIFICNDAISAIERDPEGWWRRTWDALNSPACMSGKTEEYGFGNHANGFRAVHNQHADFGVLIAAGGNFAQVVGRRAYAWRHNDPGVLKDLLEDAANKIGYTLVKKD